MNVVLLSATEVDGDGVVTLTGTRARHLREVIGVVPGQSIRVGLVDGPLGTAEVLAASESVNLRCTFSPEASVRPPLDLILAVPRPKVLKRLYGEIAAFGVDNLILLRSWRVERPYLMSTVLTPAVYEPLLVDGAMQGGHPVKPRVRIEPRFVPFLDERAQDLGPVRLVAHPSAADTLADVDIGGRRVALAVGPEGGWIASELASFEAAGFRPVSMATPILRVETAVIGLLAQLALIRGR